ENNQPYTIVNSLGQKVTSGIIENDRVSINALKTGVYFIEIGDVNKAIVAKFIKK
uniref:T9SS type A sorting domain-containing protein n=1 Tax=Flavobacterium sp. TaxID=239 RepID=UPI00345BC877